ncbi:3-isopropylmalate dehydrogenase [Marivirga harenae]|uniref:3-isopropylmalate dehydrogenase n=1 Tax=Marivirga harenae TaxID=2010992 RepID=UPI0026E0EF1A|nr:3-isopropylmalate dehydrogenase [Marivirga harenae]WKV12600.1 3-isopropylmalate dehydrogenase [Marivirga harenae]
MNKKIAILAGDGIGPEVTAEAVKSLDAIAEAFGHQFEYSEALIGAAAIDATGSPFPEATEESCKSADAILFGAIGDPKYDDDPHSKVRPEQGLLKMRKNLGLFANVRPVSSYDALLPISPLKEHIIEGTDFVVFRELTGGIYFGEPRGRSEDGNTAFDSCVYSKTEIERIAHLAFKAAENRRKKVTLVDKANVLATSRLWRETVKELATQYPSVDLDFMFVDNAAMKIIQNPKDFDVVLTENMFGDIITDEASVISGSLGLLPSASLGTKSSLFEPIHGSYPQAAGKGIANPLGAILSAAMLLEYAFEMFEESNAIKESVAKSLEEGYATEDIQKENPKSTQEVGDFVVKQIKKLVTVNA